MGHDRTLAEIDALVAGRKSIDVRHATPQSRVDRDSMANGFCDVITTFRERHADVQINGRDEGSPKQASFIQKGRPDVVDVLRFRVVPNGRGTTLCGARRCSRSCRHALCARDAIEWSMLRGEKLIACQPDQTRLTRALALQRSNLTPRWPLRRLAVSASRRPGDGVISSRCAEACPWQDHRVRRGEGRSRGPWVTI